MHIVECPHCHRKFRAPAAVQDRWMRCSRCGEEFAGSSVETPEAARPGARPVAGPSVFHSTLEEQPRSRSSPAGVIMLVGCFFGIAAVIVFGVLVYHRLTHPRVILKDAETGRIEQDRKMSMEEAERLAQEIRAGEDDKQRKIRGLPRPGQQPGPQPGPGVSEVAVPPPIKTDPKLDVSRKLVAGGAVGDVSYVCGRVLSTYDVALRSVTVTVYVNGARGPSRTYAYVPAREAIHYSIALGSQIADDAAVEAAATAQAGDAKMVVWAIPSDELLRSAADDKVVWTGMTRNRTPAPVRNVRIHCDFFAGDGIQAGSAVGQLVKGDRIGAGKSASFRILSGDPGAETAELLVARVVAETY